MGESSGHLTVGEEAHDLIRGARAAHYGAPWINFERIALKWTGHLVGRLKDGERITQLDVACMMTDLKTARMSEGYHRDSNIDVMGYGGLMEILEDPAAQAAFIRDVYGEPVQKSCACGECKCSA